jgi:dTDP-glucose pyrophosphorylase
VEAVVIAAGEGRRLRPLSERWAKPVLPIDGRPVLATLLRELEAAGIESVVVVTGHLAEQVERLVGGPRMFEMRIRFVRQPEPLGSADAVARAEPRPPYLVTAADTVYRPGDVATFLAAAAGGAGAIAVRPEPAHPWRNRIRVAGERVVRVVDPARAGELTPAPLMLVGPAVHARLGQATTAPYRPPYELAEAFQLAIDAGDDVRAVSVGPTRDLTFPVDLVRENFPYLRGLE